MNYEWMNSTNWLNETIRKIRAQSSNLDAAVLKAGLNAYLKAQKKGLNIKQILTLVDYSKPSSERRLWVIDMRNQKVLFNTWVAHGTNSGKENATSFSNNPRSLKSSLGVFLTDESYVGGNGYSMRVKGLEKNINHNAYDRSIVFHGANYVNAERAKTSKMMGRSWGCFAVDRSVIGPIINTIKENSLVVAYYPDQEWLQHSSFLNL